MKAIDVLINSVLPAPLQDPARRYNKKTLGELMARVAREYPDDYARIVQVISDAGREAAYWQGETIGLQDLLPVVNKESLLAEMDARVDQARATAKSDEEFEQARMKIWTETSNQMEKLTKDNALASNNNLGHAVLSGARGNAYQLKAMLTTPSLYMDYKGRVIPMFVRHGFNEGLRPAEYLASTFGARQSVISTKNATAEAGDFCLHEDTLIRMADLSTKRLADVQVGECVLGSDKTGMLFPVRVLRKFDQGVRDVTEYYVFAPGNQKISQSLWCTTQHKFLTLQVAGDYSFRVEMREIGQWNSRSFGVRPCGSFDHGRAEPRAALLGALLGDGCYTKKMRADYKVILTKPDPQLIEDLETSALAAGVKFSQRKDQPKQYRVINRLAGPAHIWAILDQFGMSEQYSYEKCLPKGIVGWNNASVAEFIGAFWSTDGSATVKSCKGKKYPYLSMSSTSFQVVAGIRDLLALRFGIWTSNLHEQPPTFTKKCKRRHTSWVISISETESLSRFTDLIPLIGKRKQTWKDLIEKYGLQDASKQSKAWRVIAGPKTEAHCLDLEVDHPDHLFVLACGLICSNSKQLSQSASSLIVTKEDCGTANGLLYESDDRDLVGRILAKDVAGIPAGTTLDKQTLMHIRKAGEKQVMARSTMTCQAEEGICAHCLGLLPEGHLAPLGYAAGVTAANAVGEPLTQGSLSAKHQGGGVTGKRRVFGGFQVIDQIVQSPEAFPFRAAVASEAGRVTRVEDAPQGGKFVYVNDTPHYVLPDFGVTVKPSDEVEAGDQLSDGIVDVADVLKYRGLGDARRYYVDRLRQAFEDSDIAPPSKLNLELLARANLNHVVVDDPNGIGDWLPDDVVSYQKLQTQFSPAKDTRHMPVNQAVGRYLQQPLLHFTINTKLTPRMVSTLQSAGYKSIAVSDQEPNFKPEMMRLRAAAHPGEDWLAKMHTSYLGTNLGHDAARARETNISTNVHFAPRLAVGDDFGKKIEQTGKF